MLSSVRAAAAAAVIVVVLAAAPFASAAPPTESSALRGAVTTAGILSTRTPSRPSRMRTAAPVLRGRPATTLRSPT